MRFTLRASPVRKSCMSTQPNACGGRRKRRLVGGGVGEAGATAHASGDSEARRAPLAARLAALAAGDGDAVGVHSNHLGLCALSVKEFSKSEAREEGGEGDARRPQTLAWRPRSPGGRPLQPLAVHPPALHPPTRNAHRVAHTGIVIEQRACRGGRAQQGTALEL